MDNKINFKYFVLYSIFVMVITHANTWIGVMTDNQWSIGTYGWPVVGYGMFGFISLGIPALAGAMLRTHINRNIIDNRVVNYPTYRLFQFAFFISLAESIKGLLTWGPAHFFAWNVLHLIAISFILILFLNKVSIHLTGVLGIVTFFTTPYIKTITLKFYEYRLTANNAFAIQDNAKVVLIVLSTLIGLGLCLLINTALKNSSKLRKFAFSVCVFIAYLLSIFTIRTITLDQYFAVQMHNLPMAILAGDPKSFHIWPFFPWFSIIAYGHWMSHLYHTKIKATILNILFSLFSIFLVGYFLLNGTEEFYNSLSTRFLWSEKTFMPSLTTLAGLIGTWTLTWLITSSLERRTKFFDSLALIFNHNILWVYILSTIAGYHLAKPYSLLVKQFDILRFFYSSIVFIFFIFLFWWITKKQKDIFQQHR